MEDSLFLVFGRIFLRSQLFEVTILMNKSIKFGSVSEVPALFVECDILVEKMFNENRKCARELMFTTRYSPAGKLVNDITSSTVGGKLSGNEQTLN